MSTRQTTFGLTTALAVAVLGAILGTLDPAGWHLLAVGAGIGVLTLAHAWLPTRSPSGPVAIPVRRHPAPRQAD